MLITGAAVAAAGPIAFVGLAMPHIVRAIVGPDYRWVLPYSLLGGAILLTGADIVGRVIARPGEVQVGIVTALIGAPFLIYLARRRSVGELMIASQRGSPPRRAVPATRPSGRATSRRGSTTASCSSRSRRWSSCWRSPPGR